MPKEDFIPRSTNELIAEIGHTLHYLKEQGITGFHCSEVSLERIENWGVMAGECSETLESIRSDLGDCQRCGLSKKRRNIVFGSGNPSTRLLFVGEGPGSDEDIQGEPFVGAAGQLLTRIIEAIQHTRESVYICNVVKCRPPGNRNPQPEEIQTCMPFLERQINAIKPDFICALGKISAQTLLNRSDPISRLRGRFFEFKGIPLLPTYHPAYLLRNSGKKREVWEDMKRLMEVMGIER